ncbi:MAG: DUF4202 family protein [archaeon]
MARLEETLGEIRKILREGDMAFWNLPHAETVHRTLLELNPDAPEELQIAALGHDIERSVSEETDSKLKKLTDYDKYKGKHALRSAEFMKALLINQGYLKDYIDGVWELVASHEIGGSKEADKLREADGRAFFSFDIKLYFDRNGKEKTLGKIAYMLMKLSEEGVEKARNNNYSSSEIRELVLDVLDGRALFDGWEFTGYS